MKIVNLKISVIGAVRSGVGAAKLAVKKGAKVFISEMAEAEKIKDKIEIFNSLNIDFETGGHTEKVFDTDLIITSPGVPTNSSVLKEAANRGIKVISELEFASWFCKGKVIGITGTNGKTTTTTLCAHVLNICGVKTYSAGNIGLAFSEVADEVKEDEFVALEISSFQLDFIDKFKPAFAMILNLTPDHLDRYDNKFENYMLAKARIAANQDVLDAYIYNLDDFNTIKYIDNSTVEKLSFSIKTKPDNGAYVKNSNFIYTDNGVEEIVCEVKDLTLKGEHNIANALAVLVIAKRLKLNNEDIKKAFSSFEGVEHRLEFVRELNGIKFINDSKATNVDSVWYALRSFTQPIHLILGGKDKGNDYNQIVEPVKNYVKKVYAIGSSKEKVFDFFKDIIEVEICESFEECIKSAKIQALAGEIVLLSPACASFDMFENFEHRGKEFKKIVNELE